MRPSTRDNLLAFGLFFPTLLPGATLGAFVGIRVMTAVSGIDWERLSLPANAIGWLYVLAVFVFAVVGTFLGGYVWLRVLKGRISDDVVYKWWILRNPQNIPVLSAVARKMFAAVYGPYTGAA